MVVRCHPQGSGVGVRVLWPLEPGEPSRRDCQQIGIEIFSDEWLDSPWLHFSHRQIPASVETGSLDFLKAAIEDCMHNHSACTKPEPGIRNPTRLLQIVDDGMGKQRVFLRTTSPLEMYSYTALSHCWGSPEEAKKMPKTTLDNLAHHHRDGMPISHLTRTFQDSIRLTVRLGLEYIWIDSLCIIQEDAADWAIESVTMASVYGGADLVIAATCGKDGNDGLYPPRNPLQRIKFSVSESDSVRMSVQIYKPGDWNHQTWQFGNWNPSSDRDLPLHKRAWTFQERLLAKRIVHFSPLEMVWECWTSSSCECGELLNGKNTSVYPGAKSQHREAIQNSGTYERLLAWDSVIAGYSVRDITYYQDRVQAIAGIALQFDNGASPDTAKLGRYLCGIWEVDLPMGLLWYSLLTTPREKHYKPHTRLRGWTVPTWSWLSIQGDISHRDREIVETPLATVQGITYHASPDNPYGAPVDPPNLTIRGVTLEIEVKHMNDAIYGPRYTVVHPSFEDEHCLDADIQVWEAPFAKCRIKALRITTREESDTMNCLVLCHVEGDGNQFERLGVASIGDDHFEAYGMEEDVVLV